MSHFYNIFEKVIKIRFFALKKITKKESIEFLEEIWTFDSSVCLLPHAHCGKIQIFVQKINFHGIFFNVEF